MTIGSPRTDGGRATVRLITSAKGGVGKSTVAANLGMALAMRGQRVLLIDADTANRSLDLLLGMENRVLYGLSDVLCGRLDPEHAILPHPSHPGLRLLPGAESKHSASSLMGLGRLTDALADGSADGDYDQILIDLPGGAPELLVMAAGAADEALLISSAQTTAIRSAEHTAYLLADHGIDRQKLIVNAFMGGDICFTRGKSRRQTDAVISLLSLMDTVALPLLGVIPFDASLWDKQNRGLLINDNAYAGTTFSHACANIAARLMYENVPLFTKR